MMSRRIARIMLFISILIWGVGCSASREGWAFPGGTAGSTGMPATTLGTNASGCTITIMGHGGVEIYITDPKSRHLGIPLDSKAIVNGIPGADYQIDPNWGYGASRGDATSRPAKLVTSHIPDPVEGLYLVQVHRTPDILGGGLSVIARCSGKGETIRMVNTDDNQKLPVVYQFTYSPQNQELITELAIGK